MCVFVSGVKKNFLFFLCSGIMTLFYLYKLATGGNHIPATATAKAD